MQKAALGIVLIFLLGIIFSGAQTQKSHEVTSAKEDAAPTLTVCEALSHPSEYDGKIVRISDRIDGTDEWTAFVGNDCPQILVTEGKVWPSKIVWEMPANLDLTIHPVYFTFNEDSQKRLGEKWDHIKDKVDATCAAFTYTGLFEVWSKAKARKTAPGGWVEFSGFGHLSGSGARLILKSADDVAPITNCKPKKRDAQ